MKRRRSLPTNDNVSFNYAALLPEMQEEVRARCAGSERFILALTCKEELARVRKHEEAGFWLQWSYHLIEEGDDQGFLRSSLMRYKKPAHVIDAMAKVAITEGHLALLRWLYWFCHWRPKEDVIVDAVQANHPKMVRFVVQACIREEPVASACPSTRRQWMERPKSRDFCCELATVACVFYNNAPMLDYLDGLGLLRPNVSLYSYAPYFVDDEDPDTSLMKFYASALDWLDAMDYINDSLKAEPLEFADALVASRIARQYTPEALLEIQPSVDFYVEEEVLAYALYFRNDAVASWIWTSYVQDVEDKSDEETHTLLGIIEEYATKDLARHLLMPEALHGLTLSSENAAMIKRIVS